MTILAETSTAAEVLPSGPTPPAWLGPFDRRLSRASQWLNPILVKEARQALKSRQFAITFALLLICGWGWSIVGVAMAGPAAGYTSTGPGMFVGYYMILAFPLLVIVPFGAFRSLASEQEDRTYELLCITALRPRQIISGKLGSALLQMLVYLSAISPCLAFTYLLRGISLPTILVVIFWTSLVSLGLSVIGLLLATMSTQRHWQVVASVAMIAGLMILFWIAAMIIVNMVVFDSDFPVNDPEFLVANGMLLTAYVTYFVLVFLAAAARITFASDNRSTKLRVVIAVQFMCLAAWSAGIIAYWKSFDWEVLLIGISFMLLHLFVTGALMTGESPELSLRVRRSLPRSFLGRVFLTWFNPGPGTGYLFTVSFALAGVCAAALGLLAAGVALVNTGRGPSREENVLAFAALGACYLIVYLGLGLLLVRALRRWITIKPEIAAMVNVILVVLGCVVPMVIQASSPAWYGSSYSLLHITNPFWSTMHVSDGPGLPFETAPLLTLLGLAAAVVFVANLPTIVREVRAIRIATPQRVVDEQSSPPPESPFVPPTTAG